MKIEKEKTTTLQSRKRPAALLDMDHTLVYTKYVTNDKGERQVYQDGPLKGELITEDIYNIELLNQLKKNGIRDIYLFTDMTLSLQSINDRKKLIKFLEEKGFTVHGVITPLDFFWNFNTSILRQFEEATGKARVVFKSISTQNKIKLEDLCKQFLSIIEKMNDTNYPNVGVAFKTVAQPFKNLEELQLRSNACKHAIDAMAVLKDITTCKGIMILQFLTHLPDWVSAIYVLDDLKENNEAVNKALTLFPNRSVPFYIVDGYFSHNSNSFLDNIKFNPEEISVEARLTYIANDALLLMERLKNEKTLGSFLYKTEYQQALNLSTQVNACEDTYESILRNYLSHFNKISKNIFDSYQPSILDKCLLQLISEDEIICKKIGINPMHIDKSANAKMKDEQYQLLLGHLLSLHSQDKKNVSKSQLSASVAEMPKLPSLKSSGNIPLFSSEKSKDKMLHTRATRQRSLSDADPSLDTLPTAIKSQSRSEEGVQLDVLIRHSVLKRDGSSNLAENGKSTPQLKAIQTLTKIQEEDSDHSDDEEKHQKI